MTWLSPTTRGVVERARQALIAFGQWWAVGLAALCPAPIERWWVRTQAPLRVAVKHTTWSLGVAGPDGSVDELVRSEGPPVLAAIPAAVRRRILAHANHGVVWTTQEITPLTCTVALPLDAEPHLRDALALQMDRWTPYPAAAVVFDATVTARDLTNRRLRIDLNVISRAELTPVLAQWPPELPPADMLACATGSRSVRLPLAIAPRARRWGRSDALAAIVLAVLTGIAIGLPLHDRTRALARINAEFTDLREAQRRATGSVRAADHARQLQTLVAARPATPPALTVLAELSSRLPDEVYLSAFKWAATTVRIEGAAASATRVLEALDASPLFQSPRFEAPVVRDGGADRERFQIEASLVPSP
jgi:general secretion pathway protein L